MACCHALARIACVSFSARAVADAPPPDGVGQLEQRLDPTDDYPDFTKALAETITSGNADRGVMICGSGVGAAVAANKVRSIRASVCHDTYSAHQGVEHDDMNVLCLGARIVGVELASELVTAFVSAKFTGEERHKRRLNKVLDMESDFS